MQVGIRYLKYIILLNARWIHYKLNFVPIKSLNFSRKSGQQIYRTVAKHRITILSLYVDDHRLSHCRYQSVYNTIT